MKPQLLLIAVTLLCSLWCDLDIAYGSTATNMPESLKEALTRTDAISEKPAVFDSWLQRLDYIHDNFHSAMHSRTEAADIFLSQCIDPEEAISPSRFRLGLYLESEVGKNFALRFDPDFEAEINMPNLEKRWKIFITGKEIDELPDTTPSDRDGGFSAGIRKKAESFPIDFDAGIRLRWIPEGFLNLRWRKCWDAGNWQIIPSQKVFYETDEGFGEVTALSTQRSFGANSRGVCGTSSAIRWTEKTRGIEWAHSFRLGYMSEALEVSRRKNINTKNSAREVGMKIAAYGHKRGSGTVDRYRLTFIHRRPIYKKWVYLEIEPEIEWKNENSWDTEYILRVGLDMLFWGTKDR